MSRQRALDFLIACAAPSGRFEAARLEGLSAGLDWAQVEDLAAYHRVRPLLYRRAAALAPPERRAAWDSAFRINTFRTLNMTAELISVARALAAAEIAVLPHKGPLLALAAYGDLNLREFADLDLLVAPADLAGALAVLAERGYAPHPDLAWVPANALRRWTGETACDSAAGITVDLHWRLTPPSYPVQLDQGLLWRHAARVEIAGATLTTLAPEALWLLLAVHGGKHAWEAMGWLADLAWLIDAKPGFDWVVARDLAAQSGCGRPLRLAAALISEVFGTPLPESLAAEIAADPAIARLSARVQQRWRGGDLASPGSIELLHFVAAMSTSRLTTARHVVALVLDPTEAEWRSRRLPEPLFFLYAPGRLLRLAAKRLAPAKAG